MTSDIQEGMTDLRHQVDDGLADIGSRAQYDLSTLRGDCRDAIKHIDRALALQLTHQGNILAEHPELQVDSSAVNVYQTIFEHLS